MERPSGRCSLRSPAPAPASSKQASRPYSSVPPYRDRAYGNDVRARVRARARGCDPFCRLSCGDRENVRANALFRHEPPPRDDDLLTNPFLYRSDRSARDHACARRGCGDRDHVRAYARVRESDVHVRERVHVPSFPPLRYPHPLPLLSRRRVRGRSTNGRDRGYNVRGRDSVRADRNLLKPVSQLPYL